MNDLLKAAYKGIRRDYFGPMATYSWLNDARGKMCNGEAGCEASNGRLVRPYEAAPLRQKIQDQPAPLPLFLREDIAE